MWERLPKSVLPGGTWKEEGARMSAALGRVQEGNAAGPLGSIIHLRCHDREARE